MDYKQVSNIVGKKRISRGKDIGKGVTMPLRISKELFMKKDYSEDLLNKILQFGLALCEKTDALALAGHMQAIVYKP